MFGVLAVLVLVVVTSVVKTVILGVTGFVLVVVTAADVV